MMVHKLRKQNYTHDLKSLIKILQVFNDLFQLFNAFHHLFHANLDTCILYDDVHCQ
jgi:hypothetical protein